MMSLLKNTYVCCKPNLSKVLAYSVALLIVSNAVWAEKPNIVLLFADDAGFADFGFQGSSESITPNLDKLASEGVRCTAAYVTSSVCGPSRAGLITGKYQQRFGFEENNVPKAMSNAGLVGEEMGLPLDQKTIANYLQEQQYRSALFGKWHLGGADRYHPLKRGFNEFYGFRDGSRSFYAYNLAKNPDPMKRMERGFKNYAEHEGYLTDVLAEEACAFITRNKDTPFFVFLSFNAVHTPMHALKKDLAMFPDVEGKRKIQLAMGLAMDRACGKILDQLELLGLSENTLVIFTNDNGGPTDANASLNDPLSGIKGTQLEGGIRVPFIMRWPSRIPAASVYEYPVSMLDLLPTFLDAAGADVSGIEGLDGTSLIPYLSGERSDRPHQTLFWRWGVRAAIRDGDWKLIRYPDRQAELYDLSKDISEVDNLAVSHPGKVDELYKKLFQWELTLTRPLWQLKRSTEEKNMRRYDAYRQSPKLDTDL